MTTLDQIQERLEGALRSASGADDRELAARLRDEGHRLVLLMNGLVRATRLYSLENQALDAPAQELAEVLAGLLESLGVVHVVFVEDQAYVNDVRLRLRPAEQPIVDQLVADLTAQGVGVSKDAARATTLRARACKLGWQDACGGNSVVD